MTNDISGVNLEEAVPCIALSKNDSYVMSACGGTTLAVACNHKNFRNMFCIERNKKMKSIEKTKNGREKYVK